MKGIILAGGIGSRLLPLTERINKHLLPIYNKPMIFYPINMLKSLGVTQILVVTNRENSGLTAEILGNGSRFDVEITYKIQEYENGKQTGIAKALQLARSFANDEGLIVILADNIFRFTNKDSNQLRTLIKKLDSEKDSDFGAMIFLKEVKDPENYGVPVFGKDNTIITIEEKPKTPKSNHIATGLYIYDRTLFERIRNLKPSEKGEYEITELNNSYVADRALKSYRLEGGSEWTDAGTFEGLFEATQIIRNMEKKG